MWSPRGPESNGAVRLQSEKERSRPRRAGDLSREGGKRAVTRALPREAVIEHQYIIASTLPFSNQPSSRLQLGTRTYPHLLAPVALLSKLTELTLPLRAEAAESDRLHPVCDSSQQQFAAEVRRRLRFVENAPLLPKLLLQSSGEEPPDRVPLPTHHARDFVDGRALGSLQHRDHRLLL